MFLQKQVKDKFFFRSLSDSKFSLSGTNLIISPTNTGKMKTYLKRRIAFHLHNQQKWWSSDQDKQSLMVVLWK